MRNIFLFIWKNYFFFLFLALQIFCFVLIINNNRFQKAAFLNSTNDFFRNIIQKVDNVYAYFSLADVNKKLAEENALLRSKTLEAYNIYGVKSFIINDTVYKHSFRYIDAKVINNSVNRRKNYITLNKGSRSGIRKDMGVIDSDGVVGIITDVSPNFAVAISVLNIDTKISTKFKNNNHMGSLSWKGTNYRTAKLEDIPLHVVFNLGDTIITSGYSSIFPEGVMVGCVKEFSYDPSESFYNIDVELSVDFNKLSYVYVVDNLMKTEKLLLENQNQNQN
ncbi:MAG: rod shape-determining protein MreC [Bacteroidales bacterium]|nr:rod shape-determining protein MreC [Bacteroidales bacterium]